METRISMRKMSKKRRGILVFLVLIVLVAGTIVAAIPFFFRNLPEPAKANQQELLCWLVVKDLDKETSATQLALAQRLESEFAAGVDWTKYRSKIDEPERKQLLKNIPCVLRSGFLEKATVYERIATDRRTAFLDKLIDTLEVWRGAEELLPQQKAAEKESSAMPRLASILMGEMEKLKKTVPDSQQKQVDQLWVAVQTRWLMRSFAPKG
jgi:hypothetical protein